MSATCAHTYADDRVCGGQRVAHSQRRHFANEPTSEPTIHDHRYKPSERRCLGCDARSDDFPFCDSCMQEEP